MTYLIMDSCSSARVKDYVACTVIVPTGTVQCPPGRRLQDLLYYAVCIEVCWCTYIVYCHFWSLQLYFRYRSPCCQSKWFDAHVQPACDCLFTSRLTICMITMPYFRLQAYVDCYPSSSSQHAFMLSESACCHQGGRVQTSQAYLSSLCCKAILLYLPHM